MRFIMQKIYSKQKSKIFLLFFLISSVLFIKISFAEQTPHSLSTDKRIKIVNYDANNVTLIHAHYGYETDIVFGDNETIQNV
jgi:type IV secretory pathway VirB9-like protein